MPLPVSLPCSTVVALSFAIFSYKSATFFNASNSLLLPVLSFNAAVSCYAAATVVPSGETVGCVRYLCFKRTVS